MSRFVTGEYYHIYNRGVDKRRIFLDKEDHKYFCHILKIFNSSKNAENVRYAFKNQPNLLSKSDLDNLVDIKEYCLMPNHFHLLLKQISDNGISKFLQKIGVGYTLYFNKKYDRSGVLFQGKTKSKHINSGPYLNWLTMYIHLNPVEVVLPKWNTNGVSIENIVNELNLYPWVSCNDYSQYKGDMKEKLKYLDTSFEWDK